MRFPKRVSFGFWGGVLLLGLLAWPATTRQGVNYKVTEKRIPVAVKGMGFLVRDHEYRRLAAEVTQGQNTDELKTNALFRWTREHIQPVPPGLPVVDDHISHIIIRGYGQEDQSADVFSTLVTYAGIPSFWKVFRSPTEDGSFALSFVKIQGRWTLWDVPAGIVFRHPHGQLASVEEVAADPGLMRLAAARVPQRAHLYPLLHLSDQLTRFSVPQPLRAEKQMPLPRVLSEIKKAGRRLVGRPLEDDE
jgi:hypothetical protein